jgi:hypothetical protein
VAIENARLFRESERRRHEAQALSEIARLLAETMDPRVVAQRIADSVRIFLEDTASAAVYSLESASGEARAVAVSRTSGVRFHWTRVLPPGAGSSRSRSRSAGPSPPPTSSRTRASSIRPPPARAWSRPNTARCWRSR